jgi:hypothetical protein
MKFWRLLRLLFALTAVIAAGGCPSPSAPPPTPPLEIPTALTFPQSVGIDVSKIGPPGGSSALTLKGQVTPGGEFSDTISLGSITFTAFNDLLTDTFLKLVNSLEIPIDPKVKTFEGNFNVAGVLPQAVKIDFADYDFDGDGSKEGCTGCTCPVGCSADTCPVEAATSDLKPVCYRMWVQNPTTKAFEPFMAGRFDILSTTDDPTTVTDEENAGNGRFRAGFVIPGAASSESLSFGVLYHHKDIDHPLSKSTEFFVQDHTADLTDAPIAALDVHTLASQDDPTGSGSVSSLRKTILLDERETPPPADSPGVVQYLGRFRDDFDFWSGSFHLEGIKEGAPKVVDEKDVCARISTGDAVSNNDCLDLGIDVDDEPFTSPVTDTDAAFPVDFPETPTF